MLQTQTLGECRNVHAQCNTHDRSLTNVQGQLNKATLESHNNSRPYTQVFYFSTPFLAFHTFTIGHDTSIGLLWTWSSIIDPAMYRVLGTRTFDHFLLLCTLYINAHCVVVGYVLLCLWRDCNLPGRFFLCLHVPARFWARVFGDITTFWFWSLGSCCPPLATSVFLEPALVGVQAMFDWKRVTTWTQYTMARKSTGCKANKRQL